MSNWWRGDGDYPSYPDLALSFVDCIYGIIVMKMMLRDCMVMGVLLVRLVLVVVVSLVLHCIVPFQHWTLTMMMMWM